MANKRLFIAIKVQPEPALLERLKEFQRIFRNDRIKWVAPESMHLTLKFMGETDEALIPNIREKMEEVRKSHQGFKMEIKGIGTFGKPGKPRVIWAGIEGSEPARALQHTIEKATGELGFEAEQRDFKPHLTLARVKFIKHTQQLDELIKRDEKKHFQELPVTAFHLVESKLTPGGPQYKVLASFPLSS